MKLRNKIILGQKAVETHAKEVLFKKFLENTYYKKLWLLKVSFFFFFCTKKANLLIPISLKVKFLSSPLNISINILCRRIRKQVQRIGSPCWYSDRLGILVPAWRKERSWYLLSAQSITWVATGDREPAVRSSPWAWASTVLSRRQASQQLDPKTSHLGAYRSTLCVSEPRHRFTQSHSAANRGREIRAQVHWGALPATPATAPSCPCLWMPWGRDPLCSQGRCFLVGRAPACHMAFLSLWAFCRCQVLLGHWG